MFHISTYFMFLTMFTLFYGMLSMKICIKCTIQKVFLYEKLVSGFLKLIDQIYVNFIIYLCIKWSSINSLVFYMSSYPVAWKYCHHVLYFTSHLNMKWGATLDFQQCGMCDQQRLRPAWTYTQSDQSLWGRLNILWVLSYWLNIIWRFWI